MLLNDNLGLTRMAPTRTVHAVSSLPRTENLSERIYTDLKFKTATDECETFGHDIETGAPILPDDYKAHDPKGRAMEGILALQLHQGPPMRIQFKDIQLRPLPEAK